MSFDKASMSNIVFNGCVMPGTTFGYTKMSKVTFNCCDASNTIFTGSQKSSLKFYGSNTSEALFGALENALIVFAIDEDATELVEAQQMQFDNCTGLYLRCTGLNMQLNTFEDVSGDFTFENCNLSGLAMATSSGSVTLSECLEVGIELDQETVENLAIHRPAQLLQKK